MVLLQISGERANMGTGIHIHACRGKEMGSPSQSHILDFLPYTMRLPLPHRAPHSRYRWTRRAMAAQHRLFRPTFDPCPCSNLNIHPPNLPPPKRLQILLNPRSQPLHKPHRFRRRRWRPVLPAHHLLFAPGGGNMLFSANDPPPCPRLRRNRLRHLDAWNSYLCFDVWE
jgi:hypothetical protein